MAPLDWLQRLRGRARGAMVIVEDPDDLGYRFVADPLLDLMSREEWLALEAAARRAGALEP